MTRRPSLRLLGLLTALATLAGCAVLVPDGPPRPPTDDEGRPIGLERPCDDGDLLDLGRPSAQGVPALFSTGGGRTYFSVSGFPSGGIFDQETWRAALLLGPVADLPTYDASSGDVPQATVRSSVIEGTWTGVDLEPGRYWVSATNGAEVTVLTCEVGSITHVVPETGPGRPTVG